MTDKEIRADMEYLMSLPQFRRFLWRVIQLGRIFERVADGSDARNLDHFEGRRGLVLDLLAECELAFPVQHPSGQPILTAIQILREEAQQQPSETKDRRRYDRTAELIDEPDGDDGA